MTFLKRKFNILVILCAISAMTFLANGYAAAQEKVHEKSITLSVGKAGTVDLPDAVADILVANPAVADVGILRSDRLYVVGRAIGDTNVLTFNQYGDLLADVSVHVSVDRDTLSRTLKEFFPHEEITVRTVNQDIVLSGEVSTPAVANKVRDLAGRFAAQAQQGIVDLMRVSGEQQVLLKVRVVEANRSVLREFGFDTDYKFSNGTNASGFELGSTRGIGLAGLQPFSTATAVFEDGQGFGPLSVTLQALERDGLVNVLAEPNLTAISGEQAGFLAGGEFPIPVAAEDGNITIEFRSFGVSLNFRPTVMSKDRISMQLDTEVSSLAEQDGVTLSGVDIPGLAVRRANTTVELASGSSLMIAGLIESETADQLNGMPGLKDLPVLGQLFQSKSFQREESEMVVMVTAYLVEPYEANEAEMADENKDDNPLNPLSQTLVNNLRRIYGDNTPSGMETGPVFGYLID